MIILRRKTTLPAVSSLFYISGRGDLSGEYIKPKTLLYPDIDSALSGISSITPGEDMELTGATYYIYTPLLGRAESLVRPGIIESPKSIVLPDEYWYLGDLRLKLIAAIKVIGRGELIGTYKTGPRQNPSRVYSWRWEEIVDKYKKPKLKNENLKK